MKKILLVIACSSLISLSACWYPQHSSRDYLYSYQDTTIYYPDPIPNQPPEPIFIITPIYLDSPHPENTGDRRNKNESTITDNAYQNSQRNMGSKEVRVNREKNSDLKKPADNPVEQKPVRPESNTSETSTHNSGSRNR